MNKEEIERLIKDYAEMHEKLQKVIKQFEEEESKEWKPKYDEEYFIINIDYKVESFFNVNEIDEKIIKYNKVFKTYEEAEEYANYLKAIAERTYKFSKEEWEDTKLTKYIVIYNHMMKCFEINEYCYCNEFSKFTFKTEEEAQAFIDEYGDKILKYEM